MVLTETDYFADAAEITSLLHIGTSSTSTEFSETDLDAVLPIIQGQIHEYLIARGLITAAPVASTAQGYFTIKGVLVAMLEDWNKRRQNNKLMNQGGDPPTGGYHPHLDEAKQLELFNAFVITEQDAIDVIPVYRGQYHEVL